MGSTRYRKHAGGVSTLHYHFVWCPKYRRKVLMGAIAVRLEQLLRQKANELGVEIEGLEVLPDHVHLFASFPPTLAIAQIMFRLKGTTAYHLRREFPFLRSRLPSLWTRSYYVGTAGVVSAQTIQHYIEAQRRS
jgi:putative transposase